MLFSFTADVRTRLAARLRSSSRDGKTRRFFHWLWVKGNKGWNSCAGPFKKIVTLERGKSRAKKKKKSKRKEEESPGHST